MKKNLLPESISVKLAALLLSENCVSTKPTSALAKNSRDHARFALEQEIVSAINAEKKRADELAATLDRIVSGGV